MRKYKVLYSQNAQRDISEIHDFIMNRYFDPFGAMHVTDAILERCESLAVFPKSVPPRVSKGDIELYFAHVRRYTIAYYINDEKSVVIIRRIFRPGMDVLKIVLG